jgi:diguanylate cyclase (GGDEF)-like protein
MNSSRDEYIENQINVSFRHWLSKAALFGSLLIVLDGLLDLMVAPETFARSLLYRLGIAVSLLFGYWLIKKKLFIRSTAPLALLWVATITLFLEFEILGQSRSEVRYVIGNIVLCVVVIGFIPARLKYVAGMAVIMYALFLLPIGLGTIKLMNFQLGLVCIYLLIILFSLLLMRYLSEKSVIQELGMKYDLDQYRNGLEKEVALKTEAMALTVEKMQEEISARKVAEGQLQHDALHDALTGLPNRALFNDRLSHTILMAKRRKDFIYAVLFVDLDRFKVINDSLGHVIGDQLLIALGQRLVTCLRPHDTVARLGGDEFSILLEDIGGIGNATYIADRIGTAMRAPFTLTDREVFATASIGIALCAGEYEHPDQVLRDADTAMYEAKAGGRAQYVVFEPGMHAHAVARLHLETDLRKAIERKEFVIFYQPILSLTTNSIVGFEALVRWQHPERGLLNPGDFIKMADETGMIVSIDRLVLREACRQMKEWMERHPSDRLSFISTNLSNKQMVQPDLVDYVERVLKETGLDSKNLKLEITEEVIIENPDKMVALLTRLKALGVQIYIDDFGTGYSSLSHLHRLPIDGLKIDRSFIKSMGDHGENQKIIRTIILLAHDLNIGVIAEGVETANQMGHIKSLGCEQWQGYLFSKPVDGDSARTLLEKTETAHAISSAAGLT